MALSLVVPMQCCMGSLQAYMVLSMILPMQCCMGVRLAIRGTANVYAHAILHWSASSDICPDLICAQAT